MEHHIPDEYLAVWKHHTIQELMAISERLGDRQPDPESSDGRVLQDLNTYIDIRMTAEMYDLDVFA